MNVAEGVFATDGVNRHRMLLSLAVLLGSMERLLTAAIAKGMPYGLPLNVAHDACRSIGWSVPAGIYIAKDMARQLGAMLTPDTDEERTQLLAAVRQFQLNWRNDAIKPHLAALKTKLESLTLEPVDYWHVEATGCIAPSLAAKAYPSFFTSESPLVDKDGLVDYAELLERTKQIHPGVFHEPERGLLLFAHPYFRRSLSRRNSLNAYMLRSFHETAIARPELRARLALDPDLIGLPESAGAAVVELEYWHGPRYDDAIETIPSGVTEHKNADGDRNHSEIDRTQIWWKAPEIRSDEGGAKRYVRTLEVEELVEHPSRGLHNGDYGCRYAHAEYDLAERAISHFDGAIRAYPGDKYLDRIERRIDRAGKQARYTKIFRLDGKLPVHAWKRVLSDFFRGNSLIPEYLGAPVEDIPVPFVSSVGAERASAPPRLSVYLALDASREESPQAISIIADQHVEIRNRVFPLAEIGNGAVARTMRRWIDEGRVATMVSEAPIANLAKIILPGKLGDLETWCEVTQPLGIAIAEEADAGSLVAVSVAIGWVIEGFSVTVSIAGAAALVAKLLEAATSIVRTDKLPSAWVEALRDALCAIAPDIDAPVEWPSKVVHLGRIMIERAEEFNIELTFPRDEDFVNHIHGD